MSPIWNITAGVALVAATAFGGTMALAANPGDTTSSPSSAPSTAPSEAPSTAPSEAPSTAPSTAPLTAPSTAPNVATAPPASDLKADVTQGEADLVNDQAGTNEVGEVANSEVDTAAEADNTGANHQVGEQVETGDQGTANDATKDAPASSGANQDGTSGDTAE